MTVSELLARISSHELTEWMAFSQVEPFGNLRGDLQSGIIASTVANSQRDPDKKPDPFSPMDFVPDYWGERADSHKPQTWQEQKAMVEMLNAALGGKDLRQ